MTTITYEITPEETAAVEKALKPLLKEINETPALMSLLYDIDLLPEQIRLFVNVKRLAAVCLLFKTLTDDQVTKLMEAD
ncbi:hypothetical protein [Bradyrhizobium sp. SZCCHNS3053]|uniref:hypothetical protein n=1 Tax=Bradyrhizobium sp. SZCCHNS3053 TaxID=3057322 RepID=UPI002915FF7B|nr:hypothetical protein [Bradyrhizobium sp. SZCCHNS3053]